MIEAGAEKEISREVQLLKELNHPNVVNLIEVIASKDKVYLVMEYVSGGDLFAYISKHGALKVHSNERETPPSTIQLRVRIAQSNSGNNSWYAHIMVVRQANTASLLKCRRTMRKAYFASSWME